MSARFNAFVLDLLGGICSGKARGMLGRMANYAEELLLAIADEDMLYFRVDAASRSYDEAEGM